MDFVEYNKPAKILKSQGCLIQPRQVARVLQIEESSAPLAFLN
jgi:hypothetical protein